jgi:hypothetical protein
MSEPPRLPTECVELTVRQAGGRRKTFWAKPTKSMLVHPNFRTFIKVDDQGEVRYTYNEKTKVETKHLEIYVVAAADIISEKPAVYSCKYAELEVA